MDEFPILNLFAVAVLIALTAFFVMAEFAIVKVRSTQLEPYLESGNKNAKAALTVTEHLDEYLSACQLGITLTALGIGRLAEPTFEKMLHPLIAYFDISDAFVTTVTITLSFLIATFLHVVIGELAPKTIAIQKAEQVTLLVAKPLMLFYWIAYPFIWLLNGSARILVRMFGFKPMASHEQAHTEEELRLILADSYESGEINQAEMTYVTNIFEFDETVAREVMVPRTEMIYFSKEDGIESNLDVIMKGQFTRYPVADGDKDNIVGLVNLKEIFTLKVENSDVSLEDYIRPILHVSEATPIKKVLLRMQKDRIHMAIVNDEYGGTAGLITVEDILEEIVGDIYDEFDEEEAPELVEVDENTILVSGKMQLEDLNQILNIQLNDDEVDTIGGWVFATNLDIKEGLELEREGHQFIIEELDGYQIKKMKIIKPVKTDENTEN